MTGLYIHQDVKFGVSILSLFMDYLFYFLISLFLLLCVSVWVLGFVGLVLFFILVILKLNIFYAGFRICLVLA